MKTELIKVKELKKGYGINHPRYGYLQYRGLVTRHAFTDEPKEPHQYLFWQCVDEDGNTQTDVILTNENHKFELIDKNEDDE